MDVDDPYNDDLVDAIQQSNETLANMTFHLETIENLMRLLCHVSWFKI